MTLNYVTITENFAASARAVGKIAYKDGKPVFPWSYGGLEFNFRGRGVIFAFGEFGEPVPAYVRVWIDGESAKYAVTGREMRIVTPPVSEGEHTARIMRVTEGM